MVSTPPYLCYSWTPVVAVASYPARFRSRRVWRPPSHCRQFYTHHFPLAGRFYLFCPPTHSSHRACNNRDFEDTDEHYYSRKSLKYWDKFYKRHQNKFFKDRHYLEKDWGKYFFDSDDAVSADGKVLLEVGFGAGNTIFPLIAAYPMLFVHACDFSTEALNIVKSHSNFDGNRMNVFICDVTNEDLCNKILPSSVDLVTLIFMLSAISPKKMPFVLQNLKKILKPNGHVLVRDYAVGDSAQVKLENKNQMISNNFYFRGDGTCSFYFSEDYLSNLFVEAGFCILDLDTYCRKIENHSRNMTFDRDDSWGDKREHESENERILFSTSRGPSFGSATIIGESFHNFSTMGVGYAPFSRKLALRHFFKGLHLVL